MISTVIFIVFAVICIIGYMAVFYLKNAAGWLLILLGALGCIAAPISYPYINVWQQGLQGQAELARAEQNRQIVVNEARAKQEAAKFWAQAEIERAKGVAEANKIIAGGLGGAEGYLRYLYIEGLKEAEANGDKIIYIPTEAGLPILEAGRK